MLNNIIISLDHVYDSVYAKIFNVKSTDIIRQCQYYSGHLSFTLTHDLRRYNFLKKLVATNNLCKGRKLDENDFRDFSNMQKKYGFTCKDSVQAVRGKMWIYFLNTIT